MIKRIVIVVGAILLVAAGIFFGITHRITKITCVTQFGVCPDAYEQMLSQYVGKNWFISPATKDLAKNFKKFSEVSFWKVDKRFLGHIQIIVTLHERLGVVGDFLADDSGRVIMSATGSALPRLLIERPITLGSKLTDQEIKALQILSQLRGVSSGVPVGRLEGTKIIARINSGTEVVLSVDNLPNQWTDSLQLILARSKIDGKTPLTIDLRFKDPIIVY